MEEKNAQKKHGPLDVKSARGAIALEYVLVSGFAAIVSIGALAMVGKLIRDQLGSMKERMNDVPTWSEGVDDSGGDFD
jgi:hypothetical protein